MRRMESIVLGKWTCTGALTPPQVGALAAVVSLLLQHHAGDIVHEPLMRAIVQMACSRNPPGAHAATLPTAALLASRSTQLRAMAVEAALQTRSGAEAVAVLAAVEPQTVRGRTNARGRGHPGG